MLQRLNSSDAEVACARETGAIPKSTKAARIAENFNVFDFELSSGELASITALDTGVRGGPGPESVTLEAYGRKIPEA